MLVDIQFVLMFMAMYLIGTRVQYVRRYTICTYVHDHDMYTQVLLNFGLIFSLS